MAEVLYPTGYGRELVNEAELVRRHLLRMHPVAREAHLSFIRAGKGVIGIGSAWRPTPHGVSEASKNGWSFHQDQRYSDGFRGIVAIDYVCRNGTNVHRAPRWNEVPKQGANSQAEKDHGIWFNIANESWHGQPVGFDGYWAWVNKGRPAPKVKPKASVKPKPVPDVSTMPVFDPAKGKYSLWPLNKNKPRTVVGATGDAVRYLQGVILNKGGGDIKVDGVFGPATLRRVRDIQRFFKIEVDGVVGRQTWGIIDLLASQK